MSWLDLVLPTNRFDSVIRRSIVLILTLWRAIDRGLRCLWFHSYFYFFYFILIFGERNIYGPITCAFADLIHLPYWATFTMVSVLIHVWWMWDFSHRVQGVFRLITRPQEDQIDYKTIRRTNWSRASVRRKID